MAKSQATFMKKQLEKNKQKKKQENHSPKTTSQIAHTWTQHCIRQEIGTPTDELSL